MIRNQSKHERLELIYSETFIDQSNPRKQLRNRLVVEPSQMIDFDYAKTKVYDVYYNTVRHLDETNTTFYNANVAYEQYDPISEDYQYEYMLSVVFQMSSKFNLYKEYVDYQPVIDTETSESSTVEAAGDHKIYPTELYVFYVMAQIGGMYVFMTLLLSKIVEYVNQTVYTCEV